MLARDFYAPCLQESQRYSRAVGYFASSSLAVVADALMPFIEGGGTMRLVASPHLSQDDADAILRGYRDRETVVRDALVSALSNEVPDAERERLRLLSWLIAHERLDIRLALVRGPDSVGLYHEKFGIFEDGTGDFVAFSGSPNESVGGLVSNFEAIDVFKSWEPSDRLRAERKLDEFDELWIGRVPTLDLYEFPVAARARLLEIAAPDERPHPPATPLPGSSVVPIRADPYGFPSLPVAFKPRDYQRAAVERWLGAGGRGIFEMATGTGKTLTALSAVSQVARLAREQNRPLVVIIVCPLRHLVTQWAKDARWFGIDPLLCFEAASKWTQQLTDALVALRAGAASFLCCITTNDTFAGSAFQLMLGSVDVEMLLIVDEVHNAGAQSMLRALPATARFRMGLSATPERWHDEEGTQKLIDYFGDIVFALPLEEAVRRDILSPYRYHPVEVPLGDEELERYLDLSRKIGALMGGHRLEDPGSATGELKRLLFARARLLGGAAGKLAALEDAISPLAETTHNLVYCSDASVTDEPDLRQLNAAVVLLGSKLGMRVNSYTHRDSVDERRVMLDLFARGEIQALVAIRCLDEGVDIPETRRAFILASSTNPRQFIQRRGRVLRQAPGKLRAEIWDLLAIPAGGSLSPAEFNVERRLVKRELTRVVEFASAAENGPEAMQSLLELRERYGLLDIG